MCVLGHGVYSLPLAARLTRLRQHRIREWFRNDHGTGQERLLKSDYESINGKLSISFHDLIESFVAGQLRERGVSLQRVRRVHSQLQASLRTRHPFCHSDLRIKDGQVFTFGLDSQGNREVTEVLTMQRVFPDILLPFLERLDYDKTSDLAIRWRIAQSVVVDPSICLGKPIVAEAGVATSVLATAYEANDRNAEIVADWFHIQPRHVLAAVDFERGLAA